VVGIAGDEGLDLLKDESFVDLLGVVSLLDNVDDVVEFGKLLLSLVDLPASQMHHL
jgi:hypothetical protein